MYMCVYICVWVLPIGYSLSITVFIDDILYERIHLNIIILIKLLMFKVSRIITKY